jgi:hypothetical protein
MTRPSGCRTTQKQIKRENLSRKPEIRKRPKTEVQVDTRWPVFFGFRISDFFRISAFGFRTLGSALNLPQALYKIPPSTLRIAPVM